jgi:hypothetical protein
MADIVSIEAALRYLFIGLCFCEATVDEVGRASPGSLRFHRR